MLSTNPIALKYIPEEFAKLGLCSSQCDVIRYAGVRSEVTYPPGLSLECVQNFLKWLAGDRSIVDSDSSFVGNVSFSKETVEICDEGILNRPQTIVVNGKRILTGYMTVKYNYSPNCP